MVKILVIVLLIGVLTLHARLYVDLAQTLYRTESDRKGKGYVSDEVWYVSSSRVILNKIFNVKPHIDGSKYGLTIIYRDTTVGEIRALINQLKLNVTVVDTRYSEIKAVYVESNNSFELNILLVCLERRGWLVDSIWGWRLPDHAFINNYFNLEHPPLVKYMIGSTMALLGDKPIYWRIPSIIAGLLTNLFVFLAVFKLSRSPWLGLIASLFTGLDPLMRTLSSIALLDIHVALWTAVSLFLLVNEKPYLSLAATAFGALFKFNVLFCAIPTLLYIFSRHVGENGLLKNAVRNVTLSFILLLTLFTTLQIVASTPLIAHFGFEKWFSNSIVGAVRWHTTIKCRERCPVSSEPWDWFIGRNGFVLYYFDARTPLVALGFQPLWVYALTLTLYTLPVSKRIREIYYPNLYLTGVFLGYALLWLVGNRQQYSFYAVQLTPLIYISLVLNTYMVVLKPNNIRLNNSLWFRGLVNTFNSMVKTIKPEFS